jgi:hypothetical protein
MWDRSVLKRGSIERSKPSSSREVNGLIVADLIRDWDIQVVSQRGRAEVPDGAAEGGGGALPSTVRIGQRGKNRGAVEFDQRTRDGQVA